jgi:hypothetical protein
MVKSKGEQTDFVISMISDDFRWFQVISGDFRWFQVISVISSDFIDFEWFPVDFAIWNQFVPPWKKPTNYGEKLFVHYKHEKRFQSCKRDMHRVYEDVFKNIPAMYAKLIVGNRNRRDAKNELIRKRPKKALLNNTITKSKYYSNIPIYIYMSASKVRLRPIWNLTLDASKLEFHIGRILNQANVGLITQNTANLRFAWRS